MNTGHRRGHVPSGWKGSGFGMKQKYDIAIVGAGPAGMTAALYAARGGAVVLLLDRIGCGGQMAGISEIENYPGFPLVSGTELGTYMREQLLSAGVEFVTGETESVLRDGDGFLLSVTGGKAFLASCVIFSGGTKRRRLGCPGEEELLGKGVSYCASCDGNFFRGKRVAVIGGGNAALHEAMHLAGICSFVILIHRRNALRAGTAEIRKAEQTGRIRMQMDRDVVRIIGKERVTAVVVRGPEGEEELPVDGVFVAIGSEPDTAQFSTLLPLDGDGYILAGEDGRTERKGIFAAGDIRSGAFRQIVTAAADGARAATSALSFLASEKANRSRE